MAPLRPIPDDPKGAPPPRRLPRKTPAKKAPAKPKLPPPGTPGFISDPYAGAGWPAVAPNLVGTSADPRQYGSPEEYWKFYNNTLRDPVYAPWAFANGGDRFVQWAWVANHSDDDYASDLFISLGLTRPTGADGTLPAGSRGGGGGFGGGGGGSAEATEQAYQAMEATIKNQARVMGLDLDAEGIRSLATVVVDNNWSADMLEDYLAGGVASNPTNAKAGSFTGAVDSIKAAAAAQLITLSDESAQQWAGRIVSGEMDEVGLRSMILAMAKMRYGWATDALQTGVTMSDLLAPSRDRIAAELEMNPTNIDLFDPKWQSMVTTTNDKGETRIANDLELVQQARRTDEFKNTGRAVDMAAQMVTMFRNAYEGRAG